MNICSGSDGVCFLQKVRDGVRRPRPRDEIEMNVFAYYELLRHHAGAERIRHEFFKMLTNDSELCFELFSAIVCALRICAHEYSTFPLCDCDRFSDKCLLWPVVSI